MNANNGPAWKHSSGKEHKILGLTKKKQQQQQRNSKDVIISFFSLQTSTSPGWHPPHIHCNRQTFKPMKKTLPDLKWPIELHKIRFLVPHWHPPANLTAHSQTQTNGCPKIFLLCTVLTYFSATTELLDQNLSALPTITIHQSTVVVDNGSIRDFPATVLSSQWLQLLCWWLFLWACDYSVTSLKEPDEATLLGHIQCLHCGHYYPLGM